MYPYEVEYNLHKDASWVSDGFNTKEEAEAHILKLKADGYKPRRKYADDGQLHASRFDEEIDNLIEELESEYEITEPELLREHLATYPVDYPDCTFEDVRGFAYEYIEEYTGVDISQDEMVGTFEKGDHATPKPEEGTETKSTRRRRSR